MSGYRKKHVRYLSKLRQKENKKHENESSRCNVIRKTSDEQIANIIGAVIVRHTDGISVEDAMKMDFPNTLKELQREIESDYKPTNADRIRSMSDEELAELITSGELCAICPFCKYYGTENCYMQNEGVHKNCDAGIIEWLQSEAKKVK